MLKGAQGRKDRNLMGFADESGHASIPKSNSLLVVHEWLQDLQALSEGLGG